METCNILGFFCDIFSGCSIPGFCTLEIETFCLMMMIVMMIMMMVLMMMMITLTMTTAKTTTMKTAKTLAHWFLPQKQLNISIALKKIPPIDIKLAHNVPGTLTILLIQITFV